MGNGIRVCASLCGEEKQQNGGEINIVTVFGLLFGVNFTFKTEKKKRELKLIYHQYGHNRLTTMRSLCRINNNGGNARERRKEREIDEGRQGARTLPRLNGCATASSWLLPRHRGVSRAPAGASSVS
mmetsp:Transcript_21599/g.41938  ORF Transcript_21599/g.41938 Transcript_21599/m.41938 type:complete len:127 (+) Transcript_21599:469-849(+)